MLSQEDVQKIEMKSVQIKISYNHVQRRFCTILTVSALIRVQKESLHILTIYTVFKLFSKNLGRSRKVTSLPTPLFNVPKSNIHTRRHRGYTSTPLTHQ